MEKSRQISTPALVAMAATATLLVGAVRGHQWIVSTTVPCIVAILIGRIILKWHKCIKIHSGMASIPSCVNGLTPFKFALFFLFASVTGNWIGFFLLLLAAWTRSCATPISREVNDITKTITIHPCIWTSWLAILIYTVAFYAMNSGQNWLSWPPAAALLLLLSVFLYQWNKRNI